MVTDKQVEEAFDGKYDGIESFVLVREILEQAEIIKQFARHKYACRMGEYNSIQTGDGCDCGLSDALKGTDS